MRTTRAPSRASAGSALNSLSAQLQRLTDVALQSVMETLFVLLRSVRAETSSTVRVTSSPSDAKTHSKSGSWAP